MELLWGRADSVKARLGSLKLSPAQTASLLWEARGSDGLEVTRLERADGPAAAERREPSQARRRSDGRSAS